MTKTLVQHTRVRTNTIKDSVCKIDVQVVKFSDLWDNYVKGDPYRDPKTGKVPTGYENQCALRMSATFHKVGIKMLSFAPKMVKPAPGSEKLGLVNLDDLPAASRAYELGQWLKLQPFCGLPQQPEEITGQDWKTKVKGRTGIIMFHGYWQREGQGENHGTGGHIDLWNKDTLTPSAESFLRFRVGIDHIWNPLSVLPGQHDPNIYSDLGKSKLILFWEVK